MHLAFLLLSLLLFIQSKIFRHYFNDNLYNTTLLKGKRYGDLRILENVNISFNVRVKGEQEIVNRILCYLSKNFLIRESPL